MREGIGSAFLYNMIIIFIVIVFAILAATLTYYKAFKVNTRIINSLEKFEGYNSLAIIEIDNTLQTIGYMPRLGQKCPDKRGTGVLETEDKKYYYCVYYFKENNRYFRYGVVTYITIDIPLVNQYLRIPVYTKSNRIFLFYG